ncbi:MAG: H/ACA ribonucleoprotein complex subunit GAR1/NAF1 [Nitrososphaerales archaeon]
MKAGAQVRDGSVLVDADGRRTCKVIENIGPVSAPYLSTQPLTERIERIVGQKLFIEDHPQFSRDQKFRSNKKKKKKSYGRRRPAR